MQLPETETNLTFKEVDSAFLFDPIEESKTSFVSFKVLPISSCFVDYFVSHV
jgi:hypothetical protein